MSSGMRASRSSISPTARCRTIWPSGSCSCARSGRSGRTPSSRHDPEVLFYRDSGVNHTDHRAAGMAAVDAVYPAARNPMAFPWLARSGLALHIVRRLYLFWANDPNVWVDVCATIGRKVDALRAHASQIKEPDKLDAEIREWAAERGQAIGAAAAEAFRLIVIEDDDDEGPNASAVEATGGGTRRRPDGAARGPARSSRSRSSSSGRTEPHSFHSSARPSARRPSNETSSPSVRAPAAPRCIRRPRP